MNPLRVFRVLRGEKRFWDNARDVNLPRRSRRRLNSKIHRLRGVLRGENEPSNRRSFDHSDFDIRVFALFRASDNFEFAFKPGSP